MDNLTGNAASWSASGRAAAKRAKAASTEEVEHKDTNVSDEIIELRKIQVSLENKYDATPRKQIYDVITLVAQSIRSLTDVE
jgi:hypothetical protein